MILMNAIYFIVNIYFFGEHSVQIIDFRCQIQDHYFVCAIFTFLFILGNLLFKYLFNMYHILIVKKLIVCLL